MQRDANPEHWMLAIFYYNRDNPRLFVPKRIGFRFTPTLNFARPAAWLITVGTLALIMLGVAVNSR